MLKMNDVYLMDCMEGMAQFPDKYFELAVVDPPYGIFGGKSGGGLIDASGEIGLWDIKPPKEYFDELFRVSQKAIIWGANNFTLPETEYFIVWNKAQNVPNFASAEYAWTNCKTPAKVFTYEFYKMQKERRDEGGKIHPTQKPIALYDWIFANYAKPGDKILDTHLGGGSSRIAAYSAGLDFIGFEINAKYYGLARERFEAFTAQTSLFEIAGGYCKAA